METIKRGGVIIAETRLIADMRPYEKNLQNDAAVGAVAALIRVLGSASAPSVLKPA